MAAEREDLVLPKVKASIVWLRCGGVSPTEDPASLLQGLPTLPDDSAVWW